MNTKVTIPCRTIKAMAREMMKGRYWKCVLVILCCNLIVSAPGYIVSVFVDSAFIEALVSLACTIAEISFTLSMTRYFLMTFRGQNPNIDDLTDSFPLTGKAVVMELIISVKIFLLALLFIIPGIICAIRHAMCFDVMADNPDLSPTECINIGTSVMDGNKWKFVVLNLSFILLDVVASLPSAIYSTLYGPDFSAFVLNTEMTVQELQHVFDQFASAMAVYEAQPIPILLSLVPILVTAYKMVSYACFYDLAAGNLMVKTESEEDNKGYME